MGLFAPNAMMVASGRFGMMTQLINRLDAFLEASEQVQAVLHWTYPRCMVRSKYRVVGTDFDGTTNQESDPFRIKDVYLCAGSNEAYFTWRGMEYRVPLGQGKVVGVDDVWKLSVRTVGTVEVEALQINDVSYSVEPLNKSFPWITSPRRYTVQEVVCNF
jgi:hypothetical protein